MGWELRVEVGLVYQLLPKSLLIPPCVCPSNSRQWILQNPTQCVCPSNIDNVSDAVWLSVELRLRVCPSNDIKSACLSVDHSIINTPSVLQKFIKRRQDRPSKKSIFLYWFLPIYCRNKNSDHQTVPINPDEQITRKACHFNIVFCKFNIVPIGRFWQTRYQQTRIEQSFLASNQTSKLSLRSPYFENSKKNINFRRTEGVLLSNKKYCTPN